MRTDEDGWTPLTFVAFQRDRKMLDVLLAHGVNVNAKGYSDCSPLYWAMHSAIGELPSEDKETANIVRGLSDPLEDRNLLR
jgi:ankyrin repeat protein